MPADPGSWCPLGLVFGGRGSNFPLAQQMSLTFDNAVMVAQMELNKIQRFGESLILLPEKAAETPYGWVPSPIDAAKRVCRVELA